MTARMLDLHSAGAVIIRRAGASVRCFPLPLPRVVMFCAAPRSATEPFRWSAAQRRAGGAVGESLWQFPLPQHADGAGKADLLAAWDRVHGGRAQSQLLRQLVFRNDDPR